MSRSLSAAAIEAAFAPQTGKVFLTLLDLEFPTSPVTHLRVVNDHADIVHGGETYYAYPFEVVLPIDSETELPTAKVRLDNVSHTMFDGGAKGFMWYFRNVTEPVEVTLDVVLADTPDTVEAGPYTFWLREIAYDVDTIEGTLAYETIWDEPFPCRTMSPQFYPGLFQPAESTLERGPERIRPGTGGPADEPTTPD
jgi:hypothetical protein